MSAEKIGLIAGNGSFPLLVLDAARARGLDVVVAAIREETFPEIEQHGATCLALDAGKCLLLDGDRVIEQADAAGICVVADST